MSIVLSVITEFNGKALQNAIKEFGTLKTNAEKAQFAISKAALPAAAALTAVGAGAVFAAKAAATDEAAQRKLANQLIRSTGATGAQIQANEQYINTVSKTVAVADDELRPALSSLVVATKDVADAQNLLQVALDTSAATGADLQTVSSALAKAHQGNYKALQQLSPEMKKAIKDGASFSDVLTILTDNYRGAAKASAETAEGGFRQFSIAINEAQEAIGKALLPIVKAVTPMLITMAKWVEKNAALFVVIVGVFGTFAAALVAAKVAMVAYDAIAAATTAFNTGLAISFTAVQVATVVGIATAIAGAATIAVLAAKISNATKVNNDYATSIDGVADAHDRSASAIHKWYVANKQAEQTAADAAKTAADKAKSAAESLFSSTKEALAKAKQSLRDYATSLGDIIRDFVSLSDAVSKANDSENEYNDALKERVAAYAELNALQTKGLYTTQEMADATERVTRAESNLATAQNNRTNYSQQFQQQLTAAKKFAEQLKVLAPKLSRAAMAQVISLGPVAGTQVAADLIAGTGALTTTSLNADLESLNQAGIGVGGAAIAGDMASLNQAKVGQTGNNVYITVTSADPNAVVDALKRYMRTNGKVPIKVTN